MRLKPASQTNMLLMSLGANSPVTLIVIHALLIWPSMEGRKYNVSFRYTNDAHLIRNSKDTE